MPDVRLSPSPAGLRLSLTVGDGVSRFSCIQFSRRARGLRLRGSAVRLAILRRNSVLPSPSDHRVGDLSSFFEALYPARRCPCLCFGPHLTMRAAKLGVRVDSLLLSCRTLSFPIACRFIPALGLSHQFLRASPYTAIGGGDILKMTCTSPLPAQPDSSAGD